MKWQWKEHVKEIPQEDLKAEEIHLAEDQEVKEQEEFQVQDRLKEDQQHKSQWIEQEEIVTK